MVGWTMNNSTSNRSTYLPRHQFRHAPSTQTSSVTKSARQSGCHCWSKLTIGDPEARQRKGRRGLSGRLASDGKIKATVSLRAVGGRKCLSAHCFDGTVAAPYEAPRCRSNQKSIQNNVPSTVVRSVAYCCACSAGCAAMIAWKAAAGPTVHRQGSRCARPVPPACGLDTAPLARPLLPCDHGLL